MVSVNTFAEDGTFKCSVGTLSGKDYISIVPAFIPTENGITKNIVEDKLNVRCAADAAHGYCALFGANEKDFLTSSAIEITKPKTDFRNYRLVINYPFDGTNYQIACARAE